MLSEKVFYKVCSIVCSFGCKMKIRTGKLPKVEKPYCNFMPAFKDVTHFKPGNIQAILPDVMKSTA